MSAFINTPNEIENPQSQRSSFSINTMNESAARKELMRLVLKGTQD